MKKLLNQICFVGLVAFCWFGTANLAYAQADSIKKTASPVNPTGLPGGEKLTVPPVFIGNIGPGGATEPARRVARRLTWQDSLRMVAAADSTARQVIGNATRSIYSVKPKLGATPPPPPVSTPTPAPPPVSRPADTPRTATPAPAPTPPVPPVVNLTALRLDSLRRDSLRRDSIARAAKDSLARMAQMNNPLERVPGALQADTLQKIQADSMLAANQTAPTLFSKETYTKNFLFFVMLFMLILLVLALQMGRGAVNTVYQSLVNDSALRLSYREQMGWGNIAYWSLYILFWLNLGIFIFLLLKHYNITTGMNSQSLRLLACVGGVIGVYLFKHAILYCVAAIFPVAKEVKIYNFLIIITGIIIGLALAPLNMFMAFSGESLTQLLLYIGLCAIGFMYLVRTLRSFFVNASLLMDNKFHFLLYLCAVEIAPMLILVKMLMNLSNS